MNETDGLITFQLANYIAKIVWNNQQYLKNSQTI